MRPVKNGKLFVCVIGVTLVLMASFLVLLPIGEKRPAEPPFECIHDGPPPNPMSYVLRAIACHPDVRVRFAPGRVEGFERFSFVDNVKVRETFVRASRFGYDARRHSFVYNPERVEAVPRCELDAALFEAVLRYRLEVGIDVRDRIDGAVSEFLGNHPCPTYSPLPPTFE
jgi:hypothetical protein